MWGTNGVPVAVYPGGIHQPRAIPDGAGGFFVTWHDTRVESGSSTPRIYLQRLAADGTPLWTVNGIIVRDNASVPILADAVNLCTDGAGGVYVVTRGSAGNSGRVHRLTASGNVATDWPADGVSLAATGSTEAVIVVPDQPAGAPGANGVVVLTHDRQARRILADGTLGFLHTLESASGNLDIESACADGAGGLYVVTRSNQLLVLTHVLPDGAEAWPDWPDPQSIITDSGGAKGGITLVPDGQGGAIVTWFDFAAGLVTGRAQRVAPDGARAWGANGLNVVAPIDGFNGVAVADGAGGFIMAWRTNSPVTWRAQRVNGAGNLLWGPTGVIVSTAVAGTTQLVTDSASGAIFTFQSGTVPNRRFAAKRTTLTGVLGSNSPLARLINISARAQVGSGDDMIIPGFVIAGNGTSQLLIRGIGPTLAGFNVVGALADAELTVYNAANQVIASNDNWGATTNASEIAAIAQQVGAFSLAPASLDAAVVVSLPPGLYTAVLGSAVADENGVGLVELYEVDGGAGGCRLVNLSARAFVGTGENVLIPGLVVGGSEARTLLIRAVGPTLANFNVSGVLADPQLTLFNAGGTALGTNDNWSVANGTQIAAVGGQVGAFALPANSKDAALLVTLGTGSYTVQVNGVGGSTGVCLVEVYEVP